MRQAATEPHTISTRCAGTLLRQANTIARAVGCSRSDVVLAALELFCEHLEHPNTADALPTLNLADIRRFSIEKSIEKTSKTP